MLSESKKSGILSLLILLGTLLVWEASTQVGSSNAPQSEYEALVAGAADTARIPPPSKVFALAFEQLSDPFYDRGPNDKGIGIQLLYSLGRVLTGYFAALAVAIPVGFLIGMSPS